MLAVVVTAWVFAYLATVLPDPQRDAVDVCEQRTGQLFLSATGLDGEPRGLELQSVAGLSLVAPVHHQLGNLSVGCRRLPDPPPARAGEMSCAAAISA